MILSLHKCLVLWRTVGKYHRPETVHCVITLDVGALLSSTLWKLQTLIALSYILVSLFAVLPVPCFCCAPWPATDPAPHHPPHGPSQAVPSAYFFWKLYWLDVWRLNPEWRITLTGQHLYTVLCILHHINYCSHAFRCCLTLSSGSPVTYEFFETRRDWWQALLGRTT